MSSKRQRNYGLLGEIVATVRFQRRQFYFWLAVVAIAGGLFYLAKNAGQIMADSHDALLIEEGFDSASAYTINVAVMANGEATREGRPANNLMLPLADFDEFRFKVLDKPKFYIDAMTVRVTFAEPLPPETRLRSFAVHGIDDATERRLDDRTLEFTASGIGPDGTYTVVAQIPKGTINWSPWRLAIYSLASLPGAVWVAVAALLPLTAAVVIAAMFWPMLKSQLRAQTLPPLPAPPQALPPAIVGVMVNGRLSVKELAATVVDLAERGYLTLFAKDAERISFAKKRGWQGLQTYEHTLLSQIFPLQGNRASARQIEQSVGSTLFSPAIARVYIEMYDAATAAGYFKRNPAAVHQHWRFVGLGLFFIGLMAFTAAISFEFQPSFLLFFFAGMMTMALVVIVGAESVPLLTPAGESAREDWLAFRRYLTNPEPIGYVEGSQAYYERFLPYAIVLGAESEWAARFRQHPFKSPSWFDAHERPLTVEDFASGLYRAVGDIGQLFSDAKAPVVN